MTQIKYAGIVDSSTVDYYGRASSVIYLCGCNFRCPWCQNRELVLEENCLIGDVSKIVSNLKENYLIEAVSITGGEPLFQKETLELLEEIKKETNLLIKLDTNGYCPEQLKKALPRLDLVSIDIKAPLNEDYGKTVGICDGKSDVYKKVLESIDVLKNWGEVEARTTVIPGITDKKDIVESIANLINKSGFKYYSLQEFRAMNTLDSKYLKKKSPGRKAMQELGKIAKQNLPKTKVRIVTQGWGYEQILNP